MFYKRAIIVLSLLIGVCLLTYFGAYIGVRTTDTMGNGYIQFHYPTERSSYGFSKIGVRNLALHSYHLNGGFNIYNDGFNWSEVQEFRFVYRHPDNEFPYSKVFYIAERLELLLKGIQVRVQERWRST